MSYLGYRLKIGDTIVPNNMIAKGTYTFAPSDRISGTYTDANGIDHTETFPTKQRKIQFSLRERNLAEQNQIKGIFSSYQNVSVKVWDDVLCDYTNITCQMDAPQFSSVGFEDDIRYNATQITLTEY